MKTKILFIISFFLLFIVVFVSCKKINTDYPIEIFFDDYSLDGTKCQWTNLPYNDKVIVINSNEELEKYIDCTDGNYTAIDFEKSTLLLISGVNQTGIYDITPSQLMQISLNNYKFDFRIRLDDNSKKKEWNYAITINKLNEKKFVELNLTTIAYNVRNLWAQPLEVIQATILGKWKIPYVDLGGVMGGAYIDDTFAEITENNFFMFENENGHLVPFYTDSFYYKWDFKQAYDNGNQTYITYVLMNIENNKPAYYFPQINNGILYVWLDSPDGLLRYRYFRFART